MRTLVSRLSICVSSQLCVLAAHGQSVASTAEIAAAPAAPASAVSARDAVGEPLPEGLTSDDWSSLRAAYEAGRYAAFAVDGDHRARNPGQQWTTHFEGRGFTTSPAAGQWTWGLQLEAYGWGTAEPVMATSAAVIADGPRVSYAWDATYVFVRSGTTWSQEAYLKASNTGGEDQFGRSVAVSGDTVAVGAEFEDSAAAGVGGDQSSNAASGSGAAYVFVRSGTTWTQQAYLKASNTGVSDVFGTSVAVSGNTVVVGAHSEDSAATGVNGDQSSNAAGGSGATYVFVRSGTTWSQEAYVKASNTGASDLFGWSAAVSGDTVVVGAPGEDSVATGVDGDQSSNAAGDSGAAYVFWRPSPATFCDASDGALASCPRANPGANDTGCDIQQGTGGVELTLLAHATTPQNRVTWIGTGFPVEIAPSSIVIRAPSLDPAAPVVFGDGLRCIGTPLVMLAATFASGGSVTHSHGHGAGAGAGTFYYQLWFRNTPAMYCTPEAFNLSNGRTLGDGGVWSENTIDAFLVLSRAITPLAGSSSGARRGVHPG